MVVFEWLFLQFRQHERVDKDAPFFLMAEKIGVLVYFTQKNCSFRINAESMGS
jgi:hypothetical protein